VKLQSRTLGKFTVSPRRTTAIHGGARLRVKRMKCDRMIYVRNGKAFNTWIYLDH